jgi:drug/metabolite transporter (DMT)-like permease
MKFTPWQLYLYRVIVGIVGIISGVAELVNPEGDGIAAAAFLAGGLAFLVAGITRWRKYGEGPEQDERSRRIGAWGMSYSWLLTVFFMWALFLLDHFRVVMLTAGAALGASVVVMALSAVAFQAYLSRKGDVE